MLPKAGSCASQGTCSVKKKKKKQKIYYSSNKALEKSRMTTTNKEFSYRGPIKLLDFGNAYVVDIASVTNKDLPAIQEMEEKMIVDISKATCTTEVNVGSAPVQ